MASSWFPESSETYKLYERCEKHVQAKSEEKLDDQTLGAYMAYKGVDKLLDPEASKPQDNGEAMLQYVTGCLSVGVDDLLQLSYVTEEDLARLVEIAGSFGKPKLDELYKD